MIKTNENVADDEGDDEHHHQVHECCIAKEEVEDANRRLLYQMQLPYPTS